MDTMPIYEFKCNTCRHMFDVIESVHEHDEHKEKCPKCNSEDIERVIGAINVQTSKKS
jgi:putative FmdB family regulatory protein